jgi:Ca-activated chloride channel homolog
MGLRLKSVILSTFILALISTGCSNLFENTAVSSKKPKITPENYRAGTTLEEMLRDGPGELSGDKYDKGAFNKILDQFPSNLTADQAYNRMLYYVAEDYEPHVKAIQSINPTYKLTKKEPGKANLPQGQTSSTQLNVQILLDASGSMAEQVNGQQKMAQAKAAIQQFASSLPEGTQVSLRVYGHKGSNKEKDKAVSCQSSEVVYPFAPYNQSKFSQSLNQFRPTGWTPIAKAIQDAQQDFKGKTGGKNVIYIVSDGLETCGGNPIQAAQNLNQSSIKAVVNIIGFNVKDQEQKILQDIANAGGGEYKTAQTADELQQYLQSQYTELWLEWSDWGTTNWLDVQNQWGKKWDRLSKENGKLIDKHLKENGRLTHGLLYLDSKGKLKEGEYSLLSDKIDKRYWTIGNYIEELYRQKNKQLEDTRNQIQDKIKQKENKMLQKYE